MAALLRQVKALEDTITPLRQELATARRHPAPAPARGSGARAASAGGRCPCSMAGWWPPSPHLPQPAAGAHGAAASTRFGLWSTRPRAHAAGTYPAPGCGQAGPRENGPGAIQQAKASYATDVQSSATIAARQPYPRQAAQGNYTVAPAHPAAAPKRAQVQVLADSRGLAGASVVGNVGASAAPVPGRCTAGFSASTAPNRKFQI